MIPRKSSLDLVRREFVSLVVGSIKSLVASTSLFVTPGRSGGDINGKRFPRRECSSGDRKRPRPSQEMQASATPAMHPPTSRLSTNKSYCVRGSDTAGCNYVNICSSCSTAMGLRTPDSSTPASDSYSRQYDQRDRPGLECSERWVNGDES